MGSRAAETFVRVQGAARPRPRRRVVEVDCLRPFAGRARRPGRPRPSHASSPCRVSPERTHLGPCTKRKTARERFSRSPRASGSAPAARRLPGAGRRSPLPLPRPAQRRGRAEKLGHARAAVGTGAWAVKLRDRPSAACGDRRPGSSTEEMRRGPGCGDGLGHVRVLQWRVSRAASPQRGPTRRSVRVRAARASSFGARAGPAKAWSRAPCLRSFLGQRVGGRSREALGNCERRASAPTRRQPCAAVRSADAPAAAGGSCTRATPTAPRARRSRAAEAPPST